MLSSLLLGAALASEPDALYIEALVAWNARDWERASDRAGAALALAPEHGPAGLLRGYALLRLQSWDEGLEILHGLADQPPTDDDEGQRIADNASRIARRVSDRWRRDHLSVTMAYAGRLETVWGEPRWRDGLGLAVYAPVRDPFGIRGDLALTPPTRDAGSSGGRYALQGVVHQPLGRGVWHVDAGAGPMVWGARGGWFTGGVQPFVGGRVFGGIDVRPVPGLGFRLELGASWAPALGRAAPWYTQPVDLRIGSVAFGRTGR